MSLLLTFDELVARRAVAAGGLGGLFSGLSSELNRVIDANISPPRDKALLTRQGGRCPSDGTTLVYDPFHSDHFTCQRCGRSYSDRDHYLWWVMSQHLFLAERCVHGAALFALTGEEHYAAFAGRVLREYTELYPTLPNSDNVLGPTRLFFSTYLESIWLLQLCVAVDLLRESGWWGELNSGRGGEHDALIARVVLPSAALISSYDEGYSNRQVWNAAALLAVARLLGEQAAFRQQRRRVEERMQHALLPDGSWFEGENYHLFAHRGLWYINRICLTAADPLSEELRTRFGLGFTRPFLSALPDDTIYARSDSQYAISLRQWRFAELSELALAENPSDNEARHLLTRVYSSGPAKSESGRAVSTAEVERNFPAASLSRDDLSWKSLLFAREHFDGVENLAPRGSALLASQGLALLRTNAGRVLFALDYGSSGGGHGHPDRLNVVLQRDADRWLDDMGTGSYVDESLFWFRSGLSHNAPMVDWNTQPAVAGDLLGEGVALSPPWVTACVTFPHEGVLVTRSISASDNMATDHLSWTGSGDARISLPVHLSPEQIEFAIAEDRMPRLGWEDLSRKLSACAAPAGSDAGLRYVDEVSSTEVSEQSLLRVVSRNGNSELTSLILVPEHTVVWRMRGPGPPGGDPRSFLVLDCEAGESGEFVLIHSWEQAPDLEVMLGQLSIVAAQLEERGGRRFKGVNFTQAVSSVVSSSGSIASATRHGDSAGRATDGSPVRGWKIPVIAGSVALTSPEVSRVGLTFQLGREAFRRSELEWESHGSPRASICLAADATSLVVQVSVHEVRGNFAPEHSEQLDNEHADVNSDGLQLHLARYSQKSGGLSDGAGRSPGGKVEWANFLFVPEVGQSTMRWRVTSGGSQHQQQQRQQTQQQQRQKTQQQQRQEQTQRQTQRQQVPNAEEGATDGQSAKQSFWPPSVLETSWWKSGTGYTMAVRLARPPLEADDAFTFAMDVIVNLLAAGRRRRSGQLVLSGGAGEWIWLRGDRQDIGRLQLMHIEDS